MQILYKSPKNKKIKKNKPKQLHEDTSTYVESILTKGLNKYRQNDDETKTIKISETKISTNRERFANAPGIKWPRVCLREITREIIHACRARKNAPWPWLIVSDAPSDFAVIRRRTNTFVGLAQFRTRIRASVMDHLMTEWLSSSRKYPRSRGRGTG